MALAVPFMRTIIGIYEADHHIDRDEAEAIRESVSRLLKQAASIVSTADAAAGVRLVP